jgi:hypothetical protein
MHADIDAAPAACMQAATCLAGLRAAICAEEIQRLGISTLLLDKAVTIRDAQFGAILPAAVRLQALCLASRPGHGGGGGNTSLPARQLRSLSSSMLHASAAAQAAACQLLQQEPRGQVGCELYRQFAPHCMAQSTCCIVCIVCVLACSSSC